MVSTPPRRGGKEKAPKWRGRGAGREGRRELGVEPRGRKDGEGRIDSNPNNNKAIKGRRRPGSAALFLGGFWVKGSSRSITSGAGTSGVGVSGGEAGRPARRGVRDWGWGGGEPTRVVLLGDSDSRPPSRLGRLHEALWARAGSAGFVSRGRVGGATELQRCESRRFH